MRSPRTAQLKLEQERGQDKAAEINEGAERLGYNRGPEIPDPEQVQRQNR